MHDGKIDPQVVFFSDEAWFPLRGDVNSPNSQDWSAENSGLIRELLHDKKKISVWRAISARHEIAAIAGQELQRVSNVFRSFTECIRSGAQYFQHLL